jgi:hypothetical protein
MEELQYAEYDQDTRPNEGDDIDVRDVVHTEGYGCDHDGFGDAVPCNQTCNERRRPPRAEAEDRGGHGSG